MNIKAKGKYYEYKALEILKNKGFKALRIPTSATGKQPLPDIIATKNNTIYAIEVKSTRQNRIYIDAFQIEKIIKFCMMFDFCNCEPTILIFWKKYKSVRMYKINQYDGKNGITIRYKAKS
ncbi:putative Holliday junction resolvase [Sulfolobales Beppu rod-shaped virus 1]|uniref:Putative Holliday junction resolvase n=1 Tax=Sulfolobales Beppu rod-shaped virus 1 TaxID=2493121 RepID=A0A3Q8Q3Z1_9VIRU|nr:putative Holliday junction resolvase [Sulfolobales Beppu rod-shaped virus 1]AZI75923.1 putative Holliday junction resolvase [Sulfolobales Beppu rod-shaped virus 1]